MRLDFNVLWVDDQPARVESQVAAIAKYMEDQGFNFNATLCQSIDDVRSRVADDVFTDEVDLILVDWDLGGNVQGQNAIGEIRDQVPYKDVVFYSALNAADQLRRLAFDAGLEGVYCATRGELVDEVIGVFDSLVKKVLDLDHARGIVMGATSDIDHLVTECLVLMHAKLDDPGKAAMLKEILERIGERIKDLTKRVGKLQSSTSLDALLEAHEIFTANDRLRILSRMLKVDKFKVHGETRQTIVTYINEVVPGRTGLAHLVMVPKGKPQAVMTSLGKTVTLEETQALRRQILGLRSDFRDLLAALKAME
jgi:hypothetical protein